MPISFNQIANNTASTTMKWGDQDVNIVYYPGHVTDKELSALMAFSNMTPETTLDGFASLNETLAHLIKSWDAFEDDACTIMIPIEANRLAGLPIPFRTDALRAITQDIRPN